jgi:hypothetical protein
MALSITQAFIDAQTGPISITQNAVITQNIVISSASIYFVIGTDGLMIDGQEHTVTIDGVTGYPGLVQNGTSGTAGFNTITIKDINMTATNGSSLAVLAGWIGQSYFGKGASANIFQGCSNTSDVGIQGGGITGSYTGSNGGNVTASYCSNSGDLYGSAANTDQPGSGGIFGDYSGTSGGNVTASHCFNTGDFYGSGASWSGGIFGPRSGEGATSSAIATNCYNTGIMEGNGTEQQQGGGIFGAFCGGSPWVNGGYIQAVGCFNTGNIGANSNGAGGIFGNACAFGGGQLDCSNCYNTGSITGSNSGGIIADACGIVGGTVVIDNCYSVGVISPTNNNDGIGGIVNAPTNYTNTHNYVVSGSANWSDTNASAALVGEPSSYPGTGSIWKSTAAGTPFYLKDNLPPPPPPAPPAAPTAPTIGTVSGTSVSFTNADTSVTNHHYSIDSGTTWTPLSPAQTSSPLNLSSLYLTLSPPLAAGSHTISLRAVNTIGNSSSVTATVIIPGYTAPTVTVSGEISAGALAPTVTTVTASSTTTLTTGALLNNTTIQTVNLGAATNITTIPANTFQGCTALTSVTLPSTITTIDASAFSGCSALVTLVIPSTVTIIGASALAGTAVTSITLSGTVTIGAYAFAGCTFMTSASI